MPGRDWILRIEDILAAIGKIESYMEGIDEAAFRADSRTRDAVTLNLVVIGEAATHLPPEIAARFPDVPWSRMRAMRNVLVHEYFGASVDILYMTATQNLPPLVPVMRRILAENDLAT